MSKRRIQKLASIIPFYSTIVIILITYVEMIRHKATRKLWIHFMAIFFGSGFLVSVAGAAVPNEQHPILYTVIAGIIFAIANFLFVDLQTGCIEKHSAENRYVEKQPVENHPSNSPKKDMHKYYLVGVFVFALILAVGTILIPPSSVEHIEDTNGEDNSALAVITFDEMLSTRSHYTASSCSTGLKGEKTNVTGDLEDSDFDISKFRCKKISGIMTMQATNVDCSQLILEIQTSLLSGNMEMIIMVDGEYYDHVELNQTLTIILDDIANKTVVVKFAAESAQAEISVTRTYH